MSLLGRSARVNRRETPADLSVSPPAGATAEALTPHFRANAGVMVRYTGTFTSNVNITVLRQVVAYFNAAGAEISRNETAVAVNTTVTQTVEHSTPAGTHTVRVGIRATSGASAGTASVASQILRVDIGYAQGVSVDFDVDLIKEYIIGSDKPAFLEAGNKTFTVSIDKMYVDDLYAQYVLGGTAITVDVAPNGWGSGRPLITLTDVRLNSWSEEIAQDGVILESVEGEGRDVALTTQ